MRVLGLDPSITNLGYIVVGSDSILDKGKIKTESSDGLDIQRFLIQANGIVSLVKKYDIKHVATEAPFLGAWSTERLFALQSILHLTYWALSLRVVCLAPLTVKSYACPHLKAQEVMKWDMVDAAKKQLNLPDGERLAHDTADAFFVAKLGMRFWQFYEKEITFEQLTEKEKHIFTASHTYTRGKKKGLTEKTGIVYRENELYYLYDKLSPPLLTF